MVARYFYPGLAAMIVAVSANGHETAFRLQDTSATYLVTVSWVDSTGAHQTSGTGIRVAPKGTILTVAHLFPPDDTVLTDDGKKQLTVSVRKTSDAPSGSDVNVKCDVILKAKLAFCNPLSTANQYAPDLRSNQVVPIDWNAAPYEAQEVWIRGFARGGSLRGAHGYVTLPAKPISNTDALLMAGYSGGPVYFDKQVIGLVDDGEKSADIQDPMVMGLGRFVVLSAVRKFIPDSILKSMERPLQIDALKAFQLDQRSLGAIDRQVPIAYSITDKEGRLVNYAPATGDLPPTLTLEYSVNATGGTDSTSRQVVLKYEAQPGYRIVSQTVDKLSVDGLTSERATILADGKTMQYSFALRGDPIHDADRGHLKAIISLQQQLENRESK